MILLENEVTQDTTETIDNVDAQVPVAAPEAPATEKPVRNQKITSDRNNKGGKPQSRERTTTVPGYDEKLVEIKRISKTTKGGRSMRFSVLVVVGNKKGSVGYGIGKSIEIPTAIKKAIKNAHKNLIQVRITKRGTIYHENVGKAGAASVLLKPAPKGTGIIAGGSIRDVVELVGLHDIYTKSLGSNNANNVIRATIKGLQTQLTPKTVAELRSKKEPKGSN